MDYSIKIIDLRFCKSTDEIFDHFANALDFKSVRNKSSEEIKRQILNLNDSKFSNVVLYNHRIVETLNTNYFNDFWSFIFEYNKTNEASLRFDMDFLTESVLKSRSIGKLFFDKPVQYGYRGDIGLWDDLESYFSLQEFPENESMLPHIISEAIIKLTGNSVFKQETFAVDKYNHGGMSGGSISNEFWTRKAIPLIMARMMLIKEAVEAGKSLNFKNSTQEKKESDTWFKKILCVIKSHFH